MKKIWLTMLHKIDALSVRERIILFVLCSAGILMLGFTFLIEPQLKIQKNLKTQDQSQRNQIALLELELQQLSSSAKLDPDAETKAKIDEAKLRLALMDKELTGLHTNLVQPDKMDVLLQSILKKNKRLQLISLKSFPVVNLMDLPKPSESVETVVNNTAPADERSIYKHEVELVLEGNYLDMLAYLKELEAMPERVYWSRGNLQVIEYPKASLSLKIFTLSLEKKWLNL